MRNALLAILTSVLAVNSPLPSEARTGQKLYFVETEHAALPHAPALSLCVLADVTTVFGLELAVTNQRYVASESSCTPGSHKEFFPGGFRDAQAEGVYSAALPATPDLTPKHRTPVIFGAFALLLAAIAALFAFVPSLRALIPARATPPSKSDAEAVVNVMCHMSIIDRKVDAHEIRVIARLGYEMTGHHIAPEEIVKLIKNTKRDMTPLECRALGKGLSLANRRLCYSAALKIATRHRGLIRPEVQFLRSLASGLRLSGRDVNKCVASAQTPTPDTAVVSPYDQVIPAQ